MSDLLAQKPEERPQQQPWPLHAIQLLDLRVEHLSITANLEVDKDAEPAQFSFETASTQYDRDEKQITVRARVRVGYEDEEEDSEAAAEIEDSAPYQLVVGIAGLFQVDEDRFPVEHIDHWAQRNAPLILYPYLREHTLSLTVRAGFAPMLLPLLEMPSFRVISPKQPGTE